MKKHISRCFTAAAAVIMLIAAFALAGCGSTGGDSSAPALTVITAAEQQVSSAAEEVSSAAATAESSPSVTEAPEDSSKAYIEYRFRSKSLYESHYQKHGAEFGDITKEEYLKLANDLLNSDSETVLHKTEKEDGDDVYFDTETGYFLVLSTDGYIRTFFIPDKGIAYYNKQ